MRQLNIIGKLTLGVIVWLLAYKACAEQNLALFALDEEAKSWVDLALADLSDEPGIVLLERLEMDKLQNELSLANAEEDEEVLSPSLMQNVGLFAVVKKRSLQAFDGTTGVRLLDVPVASPADLTASVRLAVQKRQSFQQENLHKISCLPLTASNLSAEQSKRAQALEALLLRRLANMPDLVVLERRHLILLLNEPNAERDKLTSKLFAGSLVLKPSLSPADDGLRLLLDFYAPDGMVLLKRQEATLKNDQELSSAVDNLLQRIVAFMNFLQPPPEEKPTMSIAERISLLQRQSEYLFRLGYIVQVEWDVSYWEQFSLPVLQDFITRSNRLFTECLGKDMGKLDSGETRKRLGDRDIFFRTISTGFIRFYPQGHSPEEQRVFERTFRIMASSCVLQYAFAGRFGLLELELGENGISTALNRHENLDQQLDAYYADLLRCMENGLLCNSDGTLPSLVQSCISGDSKHVEQKIQLQEIAMRRFGCPSVLGETLFDGHEKWSPETAKMVYGKLQEWQKWPMEEYQRQNYVRYQEKLERRFRFKREGQQEKQPLIADFVFKHAKTPFQKQPFRWNLTFLGHEKKRLFLFVNKVNDNEEDEDEPKMQLLELDLKSGTIKTLQEYNGRFGEDCGRGLFGAMTDTDFIAVAGYAMYLLPRNLSRKMRVVDLSQYGKEECHAMAVADNRVFLSFDGEFDQPGNLVEYDLASQKTKCIASTIDRSVVWPMQGYEQSYHIGRLTADQKNKRLLMLLHDKKKHPYKMQYIVRLWAYYWEPCKWEALSEYLPTFSQECSQLLDDQGRFWISSPHGLGPLNAKGVWQPLVVFDNRTRRIASKASLGAMFEGHDQVPIDYSQTIPPNEAYPVFRDPRGFEMLSPKYAISDDYLFHMETRRFYRLPDKLRNLHLVAGDYLFFNTNDKIFTEDMMLIDLGECL